jgi:hypothetical protein
VVDQAVKQLDNVSRIVEGKTKTGAKLTSRPAETVSKSPRRTPAEMMKR